MRKVISAVSAFLICLTTAHAQFEIPALSQEGNISQQVGFTNIRVYYERPAARNRSESEIFGKLVPWGQLWRTGAGGGTKLTFSTEVVIGNKTIPAGTYALYTIPEPTTWTVILKTDTLPFGRYSYDEKRDVVKFDVTPVKTSRYYESVTIDIDVIPNNARIYVSWINTQISFDVQTGTDEKVMSYIRNNLISKESNNPEDYRKAIEYYVWHGKDERQLMTFIDRGIKLYNHRSWYYDKVRLLEKQKKYKEAIQVAKTAIALIENSPPEDGHNKKDLTNDFDGWIKNLQAKQ